MLEDVQQSLWRAAAELQRVRSTIPLTPAPSVPPTPSSATSRSRSGSGSGSGPGLGLAFGVPKDVKGKGRAVFDVQEEPEPEDGFVGVGRSDGSRAQMPASAAAPVDPAESTNLPPSSSE